ncbi:MAG: hypothetical protein R3B11_03010 [Nitrospira sp.]|nr:hypothetical protein [Nitrospira sp.]MDR4474960.1 hypothetical protein [Nitrospira sp.]
MVIQVAELSSHETDALLRGLSCEGLQNVREAFHTEKANIDGGKPTWALPRNDRIYYVAQWQNDPYVLLGIHPSPLPGSPHIVNISSLARVASAAKGKAADCLRSVIQEKLVPFCKQNGKTLIVARIHTERGLKAFRALQSVRPGGISSVEIEVTSPDWSCTMRVDVQQAQVDEL